MVHIPYHLGVAEKAALVIDTARQHRITIAAAESCTGGLLSAALTDIAGASDVFERGFITYSNTAKTEQLGVPERLIQQYGAVSDQVAKAMAEGAHGKSDAWLTVAITGIAGPSGGSAEKPVGTVFIAAYSHLDMFCRHFVFEGNRREIRDQAVMKALDLLLEQLVLLSR